MSKQIGLDMKLYYDDESDWDSPDWLEVDNCRDLSGPDSFGEADVSIRGAGLKLTEATLREMAFDFEMIHDPSNAAYVFFHNAYVGKSKIAILLADDDFDQNGTNYFRIECKVLKFERSEPLEGAATRAVTLKPCWKARHESGTTAYSD